jgi:steroid delta-isomerase
MDLHDAVHRHADLFNGAVQSGDYSDFLATFADDAVMRFEVSVPVGPFRGRTAIAAAYAAQPPTDTLTVVKIAEINPDTVRVDVDYDSGGSGWMAVRWRDNEVADLTIGYD